MPIRSAKYTLILGNSEIDSGRAVIKKMENSEQTEIKISDTADFISASEKFDVLAEQASGKDN